MNFDDYQVEANKTDKNPGDDIRSMLIPLLGLAGETGELLSEYKKRIRDGQAHKPFDERLKEELGDLLWYLSNCATKAKLSLSEIAIQNLRKCRARWHGPDDNSIGLVYVNDFDSNFPETERLPRQMVVEMKQEVIDGKVLLKTYVDGVECGNELTDNSHKSDGYRFHDVFHFAYVAVLGWSPTLRGLLGKKRKSDAATDEVEDGARAIFTEEGIAAMVFGYASQHNFLEGVSNVDYEIIRLIRLVTSGLEVSKCNDGDWENAIMQGFAIWRRLQDTGGGRFRVDMDRRKITFLENKPLL